MLIIVYIHDFSNPSVNIATVQITTFPYRCCVTTKPVNLSQYICVAKGYVDISIDTPMNRRALIYEIVVMEGWWALVLCRYPLGASRAGNPELGLESEDKKTFSEEEKSRAKAGIRL